MSDLTQSRLMHLLAYDPKTGVFTRRVACSNVSAGRRAGTKCSDGYLEIHIDGKRYKAHRLAWLYIHGYFPDGQIDHLNGIRADNRVANLRAVDCSTNCQNQRRAHSNNAHGILGAYWHKRNRKWQAQIWLSGKSKHLGCFTTADAAHAAYLEAKRLHHHGCTI